MNQILKRINKSYIFAFLGELTLGLTFIFYIILARVLGPEEYGVFAAAIALAGILSLFIQLGLPILLNREVAANPLKNSRLTINFLLIEGFSSLIILFLLLPLAKFLGFQENGLIVCYLAVFSEICRSAKLTLRSVFKGNKWFGAESISVSLERFFSIVLAIITLLITKNVVLTLLVFVVARIIDFLGLFYWLNRKTNLWSKVSFLSIWQSVKTTLPFALSGVLWILYYQVDILMLKEIAPVEEAGFYSAAYRIMEMFSSLPRVIFYVTFTNLASIYATKPERLPQEIYKTIRLLLIAVLPILVIASFLQEILIQIIYGKNYLPASNCLGILIPSISVSMLGIAANTIIKSIRKEKYLPYCLLATVVINVIANYILIPQLGAVGAALATLMSEVILVIMGSIIVSYVRYKQCGKLLIFSSLLSLIIAIAPSLIVMNYINFLGGIGLLLVSVSCLFVLIRRSAIAFTNS